MSKLSSELLINTCIKNKFILILPLVFTILLLSLGIISISLAQQCKPLNVDSMSRFSNSPRGSDGKIHVTVNYAAGSNDA
jgi:hypothetical protein